MPPLFLLPTQKPIDPLQIFLNANYPVVVNRLENEENMFIPQKKHEETQVISNCLTEKEKDIDSIDKYFAF